MISIYCRRYFQHAHFMPIVGVGKRGAYYLVHGDRTGKMHISQSSSAPENLVSRNGFGSPVPR